MINSKESGSSPSVPHEEHDRPRTPARTEVDRLAALWSARLLDTPPEPAFDRLTALTRRLLGVPVSLVSLVDHDRQFFKSQQGLAEPWASARETPLSHSFCAHVVATDAPLAVADARVHPLVHDNLAIGDLGIVAYLGVPVRSPDGFPLGSLCAIDSRPRAWTDDDWGTLVDLAAVAEGEIASQAEAAAHRRLSVQYRALFEASPDAVLVIEPVTETVLDANGPACVLYGRAYGDLVGATMRAISADNTLAEPAAARLFEEGGTVRFESVHRRPDGTPFDVAISATAVEFRGQRSFLSVNRDVTERNQVQRALHDSEERFRLLTDTATDVIVIADTASLIRYANRAVEAVFGYAPAELTGLPLAVLMPSDLRPRHDAGMARYAATGERGIPWGQVETRGLRKDGSEMPVSISFGEYVSGGERVFTGIVRDITTQKAFEDELVGARETAEAAARLKSSLLANMSHEIRTPLTAIIGYAEMLAAEAPTVLMDLVEPIKRAGTRLLDTLNSVLDLAQIEGGELVVAMEPVDLLDEAERACTALRPLALAKGLDIRASGAAVQVVGDRAAVGRVLNNLVGNAVKFSETGTVTVDVGVAAGRARLRVADTGVGISAAFLPDLFDEFKQESEGYQRTHEGNGLGLAITKRLVDLMGGAVSVESERGAGSEFTVWLPLVG